MREEYPSLHALKLSHFLIIVYALFSQAQKICPEGEWNSMLESLKKDLPTAFRITNCSPEEAKALLSIVESKFFKELVNDQETSDVRKFLYYHCINIILF